jgi:Flp pilus assembly protein TadG
MSLRTGSGTRPADEGSVAVFVVLITTALLAAAGLVIDGGNLLAARQQADSVAEQAARAGADALARESIRTAGPVRVDPAAANAAVERYLATTGYSGETVVAGDTVTVTVQVTQPTAILSAVGIETMHASATASARGLTGIDQAELDTADTSEAPR